MRTAVGYSGTSFRFGLGSALLVLAVITASVTMLPAAPGDEIAVSALGENDLTHAGINNPDGSGLSAASAQIAVDRSVTPNRIYAADPGNNRVLGWSTATAFSNGQAASIVFGQPDFSTTSCNDGSAPTDVNGVGPDSLCGPKAIAVDAAGNVYISDTANNRVLQYGSPFAACTQFPCVAAPANLVFGQGAGGANLTANTFNCTSAPTSSTVCNPQGLSVDGSGNLYVVDAGFNRMLVFDAPFNPAGLAAGQVFGQGATGNAFDLRQCNSAFNTPFTNADADHLCGPSSVATDSNGNIYISDTGNQRVLEYNQNQSNPPANFTASAIFGLGAGGDQFGGPGGFGACPNPDATHLCNPAQVALDADDNLYVADGSRVLEFPESSTPPANFTAALALGQGSDGTDFVDLNCNDGTDGYPAPSGTNFCNATGVAIDLSGTTYALDGNRVLGFPESTNPPANATPSLVLGQNDFTHNGINIVKAGGLNSPLGMALDNAGHLYVADSSNSRVLGWKNAAAFASGQSADLVLGQPDFAAYQCDDGIASGDVDGVGLDSLCAPSGVATDSTGDVWVGDEMNGRILEYNHPFLNCGNGSCSTVAADFSFPVTGCGGANCNPSGLTVDGNGNLYVAAAGSDTVLEYNNPLVTGHIIPDLVFGQVVAGSCGSLLAPPLDDLDFCGPSNLATDSANNLYVADSLEARVAEFDEAANPPTNTAPDFQFGSTSDDSVGADTLSLPSGVAIDSGNHVFIADLGNARVLEYSQCSNSLTNATAQLVFGQGASGTSFDSAAPHDGNNGDPLPTASGLVFPRSVAVDGSGNLYVLDANRVLRFDSPALPAPICGGTPAPTMLPTATPTPAPTPTLAPPPTPIATPSSSPTPRPAPSPSTSPTATPAPTAIPSPTATPTAIATPSPTAALTSTPTPAPTPSATPTMAPTPTAIATPSPTAAPTATPTPALTPSPTPTPAPPPPSATATPVSEPTPTQPAAPTPTSTRSAKPTHTPKPTRTPRPTPAPTPSLVGPLYAAPATLDFNWTAWGGQRLGTYLTNPNRHAANIFDLSIEGSADFSIDRNDTTCGSILAAGHTCRIAVEFNPEFRQPLAGWLAIRDDARNSPQKVTLQVRVR